MHGFTRVFLLVHWENIIIFKFYGYGIICSNRSGNGLWLVDLRVRWLFAFNVRYLIAALSHVVIPMMWFFYFRFACQQISWLNDVHGLNWVHKVVGKHSVSIRNLLCWWQFCWLWNLRIRLHLIIWISSITTVFNYIHRTFLILIN